MINGNLENQGNLFLNEDEALGMVKQAIDFLHKPYESETSKDRPISYYWRGISNESGYEQIKRNSPYIDFKRAFYNQMATDAKSQRKRLQNYINDRRYEIKKIRESIYQVGDNVLKCVERDDFKKMLSRAEQPSNVLATTIVKTLREVTEYLYFCNDTDWVLSYYVSTWYTKQEKKEVQYRQFGNLKWCIQYYEDKGLAKLLQGYQTLKVYYNIVPNKMSAFWEYLSDYVYMTQIENWKFNWSKLPLYIGTVALGFAFAEFIIRVAQGTTKGKTRRRRK